MTLLIGDFSASATSASTAITAPEPHWLVGLLTGTNGIFWLAIAFMVLCAVLAVREALKGWGR